MWCLPRSPKCWSWLSSWAFNNLLHHPWYPPESKTLTLPAMFHWELSQQKEWWLLFAAPTRPQLRLHFRSVCWTAGQQFQAVLHLPFSNTQFKTGIVKTTLVMLQKEFNKFSKPVGLLGGAQIGSPQTDRNQCVNFNSEENRRYFSSITCCLTELREEPKNSNSSLTFPLHQTMLPPI